MEDGLMARQVLPVVQAACRPYHSPVKRPARQSLSLHPARSREIASKKYPRQMTGYERVDRESALWTAKRIGRQCARSDANASRAV
jgi:hypothetical protein